MAEVEVLAESIASPEGPAFLPDGRIIFVETFRCRVLAWSSGRGTHVYADVGGAPSACAAGEDGAYVAQNGTSAGPWLSPEPNAPSIQKIRWDGTIETVVDSAEDAPLLGPNDLAFGPDGRLYFTDPGAFDAESPQSGRICVAEQDGTTRVLEELGHAYPNGIVAEPDGSIVWTESFSRCVRRRRPNGSIELLATLPEDRILDGLKIAANGRLYVTGVTSGGVDVLSAEGDIVGFLKTGGTPLNCVFAGPQLYIADFGLSRDDDAWLGVAAPSGRLLRLTLDVEGQPLYRGIIAPAKSAM